MCQHDPTYAIENNANGGYGCPLCLMAARVVKALEQAEAKPGWFVNPLVIIDAAHEQADAMVDGFHAAFPDEFQKFLDSDPFNTIDPIEY